MKLSDIKARIIKKKEYQDLFDNPKYKEVIDIPTAESVELTFPDGTKLIFTNSEWASLYIQEPS